MTTTTAIFTHNLRRLRTEAKLSQQEVANAIGVSQPGYAGYESGKNIPPYTVLAELSKFFGKTFEWFITDHDKGESILQVQSQESSYVREMSPLYGEKDPKVRIAELEAALGESRRINDIFFDRIEKVLRRDK